MTGDYISREAALSAQNKSMNLSECRKRLESIPAADVRPVVLCRDCEYWQSDCGWCGYFDIGMNIDDFCSRGKKEES